MESLKAVPLIDKFTVAEKSERSFSEMLKAVGLVVFIKQPRIKY